MAKVMENRRLCHDFSMSKSEFLRVFKFNLPLHSQLNPRSSAQEPNALQRDLTSPLFGLQSASLSDVQTEHLSEVQHRALVVD